MNVVVIALNGCPVSFLGPYGCEWVATPNLDRVAADGVVFDRHLSDRPTPAAARRAWRTGQDPASPDLPAFCTSAGVRTVLVNHCRPANDPPADFLAGWDEVVTVRPDPADRNPSAALLRELPAVLDRLGERFLLWVECDRLLPPWHVPQAVFDIYVEDLVDDEDDEPTPDEADDEDEPDEDATEIEDEEEEDDEEDATEIEEDEPEPEPEPAEPVLPWADPPVGWFDKDDLPSWELLHRSFGAAVTAFDADLGDLFEMLRSRGFDQSAAWVVTADRGFPLGEHGLIGPHRPWLHEELVHLPLIVRLPDAAEAGRRVSALTQPADLLPTLRAWLTSTDGGLLPLTRGEPGGRPFAVTMLELGDAAEWAIRTPDWALLLPVRTPDGDDPRPPMLFEKPADVCEVNDLRPRNLELAEELEAKLRAAVGPTPENDRAPG